MHACLALLLNLIGVAGLYFSLGADFVGTTQIMVYIGGVVILMVFAVMLTGGVDFKSKRQDLLKLVRPMGSTWTYAIGGIVSLMLVVPLTRFIYVYKDHAGSIEPGPAVSTVERIGELLLTKHILAFEVSSVLLLGALVGAAFIARPYKDGQKKSNKGGV